MGGRIRLWRSTHLTTSKDACYLGPSCHSALVALDCYACGWARLQTCVCGLIARRVYRLLRKRHSCNESAASFGRLHEHRSRCQPAAASCWICAQQCLPTAQQPFRRKTPTHLHSRQPSCHRSLAELEPLENVLNALRRSRSGMDHSDPSS